MKTSSLASEVKVSTRKSTEDLLFEGLGKTTATDKGTSFLVDALTGSPPPDVIDPLPDAGETRLP